MFQLNQISQFVVTLKNEISGNSYRMFNAERKDDLKVIIYIRKVLVRQLKDA